MLERYRIKMTLIQDGCSDIHNNPVIATSIHTGLKFLKIYLLNAVESGANKKQPLIMLLNFKRLKRNSNAVQLGLLQITKRKWNQYVKRIIEFDNTLVT